MRHMYAQTNVYKFQRFVGRTDGCSWVNLMPLTSSGRGIFIDFTSNTPYMKGKDPTYFVK